MKEKQKFLLEETERVNIVATSSTREPINNPCDIVSWKLGERRSVGGFMTWYDFN
jgi:hypothetical protein